MKGWEQFGYASVEGLKPLRATSKAERLEEAKM